MRSQEPGHARISTEYRGRFLYRWAPSGPIPLYLVFSRKSSTPCLSKGSKTPRRVWFRHWLLEIERRDTVSTKALQRSRLHAELASDLTAGRTSGGSVLRAQVQALGALQDQLPVGESRDGTSNASQARKTKTGKESK